MNRNILRGITAAAFLVIASTVACNKDDETNKKDEWLVHNYCVLKRPQSGVQCAQNDTLKESYPADFYKVGQTVVVSQDENIVYYKTFLSIVRTYE
ncbi:hypothetical protein ACTHGU_04540 [Chitinophagaceae bacterium MMS25-I14]